jgi:hypothetical protein
MMNVNYFIRLSFHKLETFDVNRTSLSTFVLVRNSLISALTEHKNDYNDVDDEDDEDIIIEEDDGIEEDEQGEVWLDSCFDQLEQEKEEEEDSDEDMPLSPQQDHDDDFYTKQQNQALIRYDLPLFLSLD